MTSMPRNKVLPVGEIPEPRLRKARCSLLFKVFGIRKKMSIIVYFVAFNIVFIAVTCIVLIALSVRTTQRVSNDLVDQNIDQIGAQMRARIKDLRDKAVFKTLQYVRMTTGPMFDRNPASGHLDFANWTLPATILQQMQDDPMFNAYIYLIAPNDYDSFCVYFENVTAGIPFLLIQTYQMGRNATVYFLREGAILDFERPDVLSQMRSIHEAPAWQEVASMSIGYKVAKPSPTYYLGELWTAAGLVYKDYTSGAYVNVRMMQFDFAYFTNLATLSRPTKHSISVITDGIMDTLAVSDEALGANEDLWIPLGGDLVRYKRLNELNNSILSDLHDYVALWNNNVPDDGCGGAQLGEQTTEVVRTSCSLKLGGKRHFVDIVTWKENSESVAYYTISLIPKADIAKDSEVQTRNLAIISTAVAIATIAISTLLAVSLSVPILRYSRILSQTAKLSDNIGRKYSSNTIIPTYESETLKNATRSIVNCVDTTKKYCSTKVLEEVISGRLKPEVTGELCDITTMFVDVVDYTKTTGELGPEIMIKALQSLFQVIINIVCKNPEEEPTLDKFIGDCLMVFYNQPGKVANHARVAVYHALEIKRVINDERCIRVGDQQTPLKVKIGIASGSAFVGNYGSNTRMNYTAIGSSVNMAARLENMASLRKWQVGVSQDTCSRTADFICYRPMILQEIKGFVDGKTRVYEAICRTEEVTMELAERNAEWALLVNALENKEPSAMTLLKGYLERNPEDAVAQAIFEDLK
jgi:class 3 adenylate cyclase